jgi:hypothetical protein
MVGHWCEIQSPSQAREAERMRSLIAAFALILTLGAGPAWSGSGAGGTATAVFGFEIRDTSGERHTAALQQRLQAASELLRRELDASARYDVVSLDGQAEAIATEGYLAGCNGCELAIAREVGARWSVRGLVHKVSTLILYIQVTVTDAETERVVREGTVGIRGDTAAAYRRGVRFLVRDHLTGEPGE